MRPDHLIFTPDDVDLARSPLRGAFPDPTYVLGAFNPGLTGPPLRQPAADGPRREALREPVVDNHVRAIRWTPAGYVQDAHPLGSVDMRDPRQFAFPRSPNRMLGLTSLSWLLPVELDPDGGRVSRSIMTARSRPPPPTRTMAWRTPASAASAIAGT
jgi:hypothetical protein